METAKLKKFAQAARTELRRQVETKLIQVLHASSAARRENPQAVAQLERQIQESSKEQVIEKVAYTWFNRFCALRFLDVNGFTNPRVLTPMEGQITPEILAEAKMGHLDEDLVTGKTREKVLDLLAGKAPSSDPQGEAYRLLLVSACNHWYRHMPFLFEQIADYTELLMPENLLSQGSIVTSLREVMSEDICQDVEVIGWLYQFYISEKKDQVFAGLKKNQKITAENLPAATQLFTPHWIVRYLVENSLGRLWLLNHPQSKLAEKMDYYIAQEEPETDFLRISSPEEIRICDPACGSGHMLTYAFDLLYVIYEEEGYDPAEIPALILTHNLYGVEIDDRAGALAAFALAMKAAARLGRRRFLRMDVQPNICVLENVTFTQDELHDVVAIMGRDLFTDELRETLMQFEQAKNFGSLIVPKLHDPAETLRVVEMRDFAGDLLLKDVQGRMVAVLRMAEFLSSKYHVVVANPPYAGIKALNPSLAELLKRNYQESKGDLFSGFIERCFKLTVPRSIMAYMAPFTWMFITSFEGFRRFLLENSTVNSLIHPEYHSFFSSAFVPVCAFTLEKGARPTRNGDFFDLQGFPSMSEQSREFSLCLKRGAGEFWHKANSETFLQIPGAPIAYWVSEHVLDAFAQGKALGEIAAPRQGLATSDNDRFLRLWFEVSRSRTKFGAKSREDALESGRRWFPYNKGGAYRKWFGNNEFVVNWEEGGRDLLAFAADLYGSPTRTIKNIKYYFQPSITWSALTVSKISLRWSPEGFVFDTKGQCVFHDDGEFRKKLLGLLNSSVTHSLLSFLAPTMDFNSGTVARLPVLDYHFDQSAINEMVNEAQRDWNSYETSWDFTTFPPLSPDHQAETLEATYTRLRTHWQGMTDEMQRLEEENNRIFIGAYGLQGELTPEVPIEEITLTCNPAYRYGVKVAEEDREKRLLSDTMAEFMSYAVGCMFGRYSLDKPGLILANQGETLADYLQQVSEPLFMPDEDNVIPVLDGEWFADDVTERFRQFLRVTFGEEHYEENLAFIETALGKDVRKYFLKDFYADHVKRYRKRPIYWLFSSPKGTFNALVYLHRYRPDTVSVVLQYLRDFRKKLAARLDYLQQVAISTSASQGEKTRANKEAETIKKQLLELDDYERDTLYPLATEQVQLDLDDGVKVNYLKLGAALKKIPGLEAKED
ncbi:BREX-1 system adenine-specific DNA-methyltransferase PglX [Pseudomonas putida]|uniref:site-specific DNA-methyltransferase (adenine-specific) n=1 Tax=Pseudomonas putida TaxID=303 RepID=A0A7D5VZT7_PSEPU|nr:BREX-1 system adenine-specific DNA-methyltransferase PglX [Pseudomonas putida]QLJ15008.1 BREX-1 system adenine-specific DNA-methyltransferase PglX [Pseudomonas putida]